MPSRLLWVLIAGVALIGQGSGWDAHTARADPARLPEYHTAWTASMATGGTLTGSNYTCRFAGRTTISGDAVRIRLSNALGHAPLTIDHASVAIRSTGQTVTAAPLPLSFDGRSAVTIPAGRDVMSDERLMRVREAQDIAVSVHVEQLNAPIDGSFVPDVNGCTDRGGAAGDHTRDIDGSSFTNTGAFDWWLDAITVRSTSARGTVVAMGDSITAGTCTGPAQHQRWTDILATRLDGSMGVANEGIPGNQLEDVGSTPGALSRLNRDVFSLPSVTTLILYEGTNDIRSGVDSTSLLRMMRNIVRQSRGRNIRVVGATIIPRGGSPGWAPPMELQRQRVNSAIRSGRVFDAVIDFDKVVAEPTDSRLINRSFVCDEVHPNIAGLFAMGTAVPLNVVTRAISG